MDLLSTAIAVIMSYAEMTFVPSFGSVTLNQCFHHHTLPVISGLSPFLGLKLNLMVIAMDANGLKIFILHAAVTI